jgi:hypothetical protein
MKAIYFTGLTVWLFGARLTSAQTNLVITQPASATPGNTNTILKINYQPADIDGKTLTGSENIFLGYNAGSAYYLSSDRNTVLGTNAAAYTNRRSTAIATDNTLLGTNAGSYLIGSFNTLTGSGAGGATPTNQGTPANNGFYNVFTGYQAGYTNQYGRDNTFLGSYSGRGITNGSSNVAVGVSALAQNSLGSHNVVLGDSAGYTNTASANLFVGSKAGFANQTGAQNTFIGYQAGYNTTVSASTFIGYQAGRSNTSGQFNTFLGVNAGFSNTTGNSNFMLGTNAGSNNTAGNANFFVGDNAGGSNTTGGFNVFLGTNAGASNTVGSNNTAIGFEANVGSGNLVNATAIGFRAVASANNSLVLGNGANVGIGTSSPTSKLHLVAGSDHQSGLRLANLTSNSPASATGQTKFLTVDGSGNVILGSTSSGGRVGADLWQQKGQYLQNVAGNGVVIGEEVSKTPTGYRLYVQDGILTEKVKVAVKNASEWSDYVFAPTYKLTPLVDVEQHIKQKGHLPGVPSAAEVVEQGVDMAKMDAKLLEKIEELTLYMISAEKQMTEVKNEVNLLRQENQQLKQELKATQNKLK